MLTSQATVANDHIHAVVATLENTLAKLPRRYVQFTH